MTSRRAVEPALAGQLPETSELLYGREVDKQTKAERKVPYVVQKRTLLTGAELTRAEVQADPNSLGNWQVAIEFTSAGARIFGEITEQNVGEAPGDHPRRQRVFGAAHQRAHPEWPRGHHRPLHGRRRARPGHRAAGRCLPAPVVLLEERTVGPSLGADSIRQGLIAITASAVVVFIFMLVYYRLSGLIADVALGLNLLMLFAFMAAIRATLTLPGLAGIALTVGMAVDTNILIFERIREELRLGKTPRSAIEAGFRRAFRTIVDTHLTVMGTAIILLVLRHQLRQGLRRLAVHRTRREPLHRVLLHAPALRPGVHGPAQGRAGLDLIELFGTELRLHRQAEVGVHRLDRLHADRADVRWPRGAG